MQLKKIRSEIAHSGRPFRRLFRGCINFVALASVILPGIGIAATQNEPILQRMVPIPHPITSLLRAGSIHRELGMMPVTIDQVQQAVDEVDQPLWRLRDLPPDERNQQAAKLIDQLRRRLSKILPERQIERLNQIVWQAQGLEALLEPEVAARIRFSEHQTTEIAALLKTAYKRIAGLRMSAQIQSESVRFANIQQVRTETQQKIAAVLNSSQQNAFTVLLGPPMDLSKVRSVACKVPEIETKTWINSSPIKLSSLEGKVTVVTGGTAS